LKIELKIYHFDAIEVVEADTSSQNMTFRMNLKNGISAGDGAEGLLQG
jgi:hypothetical protein